MHSGLLSAFMQMHDYTALYAKLLDVDGGTIRDTVSPNQYQHQHRKTGIEVIARPESCRSTHGC